MIRYLFAYKEGGTMYPGFAKTKDEAMALDYPIKIYEDGEIEDEFLGGLKRGITELEFIQRFKIVFDREFMNTNALLQKTVEAS